MEERFDIKSCSMEELREFLAQVGQPAYRARQIFEWLHQKMVTSFDEMTNLPVSLRTLLAQRCRLMVARQVDVQVSREDGTAKFLFQLQDGSLIESVLMRYHHGNSVCISSQVGCRMGCRFCASTIDGLSRNLTASEMLEQVYAISRYTKERVTNVVVMGSGEPMDNFDNLNRFIDLLNDENGINISQRNLTVSTCGLVERIRELADRRLAITLAISLHASNDEKRRELMPIANKYSIEETLDACRYYFARTGRRITFEYSLVMGVNDTKEDAKRLGTLLRSLNCHVNLIPVNPIKERDFRQSKAAQIQAFKNRLEKNGITVTIRREMGRDIDGACGQLRRRHMEDKGSGKEG